MKENLVNLLLFVSGSPIWHQKGFYCKRVHIWPSTIFFPQISTAKSQTQTHFTLPNSPKALMFLYESVYMMNIFFWSLNLIQFKK